MQQVFLHSALFPFVWGRENPLPGGAGGAFHRTGSDHSEPPELPPEPEPPELRVRLT